MFEKEIQFITDFNLNKIKNIGSSFTFDELFNSDLHPSLIKYISGRIDLMIYEERRILLENSRFDYSGSKITGYFNLIADEIKKTRKLTFKETEEFVKKGVIFNANYCVKPKSTLTNLIFKDSDSSKNSSEIKVYLNYIYYYEYYREIINSFVSRKRTISFSREEFRNLLDKIDNLLLLSKKEEIISDAITSVSDFYNDGGVSKSTTQPALIEAYLKEKDLMEMVDALQRENGDTKKKIDNGDLKRILFTASLLRNSKEELPDINELENIEPAAELKDETVDQIDIKHEPETENFPGIEFKEEKGKKEKESVEIRNESSEEKSIEVEKPDENVTIIPDKKISAEPEEIKKENIKEPIEEDVKPDEEADRKETIFEEEIIENYIPEEEIDMDELIEEDIPVEKGIKKRKDIFSYLTQKDIDKIVSGIFNDDEDDFINSLEKISDCEDYDKAAEILESIFRSYKINPYKREAVTLTNVVSNYFEQD